MTEEAMKIYLSPSQQSYNKYTAGNTDEKEQCHRIAKSCEAALTRCGFEVKSADESLHTSDAIAQSNDWGADLHVCIHTNAGGGKGCVVFVSKLDEARLKFAKPVYDELSAITAADESYGVRTANFAEIRKTAAKCIYIEAEFHDDPEGALWIIENTDAIAEAICRGICKGAGAVYSYGGDELEDAKSWAVSEGLIRGYKDGSFGWKDPLTREQLALIEYRISEKEKKKNG